jgi:hypothetical protein
MEDVPDKDANSEYEYEGDTVPDKVANSEYEYEGDTVPDIVLVIPVGNEDGDDVPVLTELTVAEVDTECEGGDDRLAHDVVDEVFDTEAEDVIVLDI